MEQKQLRDLVISGAKIVLALLILVALFYRINLTELKAALLNLSVETFSLLILLSALLIYISALKWSYFLRAFGTRMSVITLFNLYLIGYFINLLLPSVVGGDAVRSWYVGKKTGQHEAFTATILERYTGFVAMVLLAATCMWWVSLVTWQIKVVVGVLTLGVAGVTILALLPGTLTLLEKFPLIGKVIHHIKRVQEGFHIAKRDKVLLFKAFVLSFAYHCGTIANTVAAAYAVGWWNPPIFDLFVVIPLVLLLGAVPITPGGLGIQEGAFYYFLQSLGATAPQAAGVAIILRAKSYLLAIIGGGVWLRVRGRSANGNENDHGDDND